SGLEALTRLEAYEHWGRMPHHTADADLLAAGLYLQLGVHNEAGARFARLLNARVPLPVRNRAWFYLGRIWYERGYYDQAEQAFERIQGQLAPDLEGERNNLVVNALMHQGRYDAAIARLTGWRGPRDWMAFAQFNLGVALVRANRLAQAAPILTEAGTAPRKPKGDTEELASLRDRANLALGFAYLQANQPAPARTALARVRLNGPYSSRALLADGWAQAALGQYREALVPWLALHQRNLLDAAVQESYLAVPYAFSQLNAGAQAAQYYQAALQSFAGETRNLQAAITHVKSGGLLSDLLGDDRDAQHGWFWQLHALPDAPQSRYLYELLADDDFQEGLKNYRDLGFMQQSLSHWDGSMAAFAAMIDARARAYAERVPRADALLATDAPTKLRAQRTDAESKLQAIETDDDVVALATPRERAQWQRIERMQAVITQLPPSLERDNAADKLRLIHGVLYWRLESAFKARSYQQQRSLREVDVALEELQNRWVLVQKARASVATTNGELAARVSQLGQRIDRLHADLASAEQQQAGYLDGLAESALDEQQTRLASYSQQASFALANLYDRAANADTGRHKAGAPATSAAAAETHP
ncbi:MAG TPA: tetratricopeptide repeat protein, partial [Steroidobacteraceae bacterium]|nr:tetratricopeptide repeat protein [Steroidobacteraceae bacterium]